MNPWIIGTLITLGIIAVDILIIRFFMVCERKNGADW